jgi:hypothetical protein
MMAAGADDIGSYLGGQRALQHKQMAPHGHVNELIEIKAAPPIRPMNEAGIV